ncbi:MAG: single-stranded DNA-binding protein [Oscillospiraceae bacterium]|nr:single-stranded DNA-binding protein [Oscillospiraceae bacterium]
MNWNINAVTLCGKVISAPQVSHTTHRETFYGFVLESRRLSGIDDYVKIICPESMLKEAAVDIGDTIAVQGALRSYNNKSGIGNRLIITVLAQSIIHSQGEPHNIVSLCGTLCKAPVFRKTPLGREICDMLLAVNRRYGRADYLPCIVWGGQAREFADCEIGTKLSIEGRIQSRTYQKIEDGITVEKIAYEVSIGKIEIFDEIIGNEEGYH